MPLHAHLQTPSSLRFRIRRQALGSVAIFMLALLGACQSSPPLSADS